MDQLATDAKEEWAEASSFNLLPWVVGHINKKVDYNLTTVHLLRSHGLGKENIQKPLSWPHTERMTLRVTVSTLDKGTSTSRCCCQQRECQKHTKLIRFAIALSENHAQCPGLS